MKLLPGLCAIAIVLGTGFGCSKEPSSETAKAQNLAPAPVIAATLIPFPEIASFEKKAPNDLVADSTIGKVIRSIVPQAQLKCMDEILDYMPDLQLSKDGSVTAELSGSHADNFMVGYVNASPTGEINIVLQCLPPDDKPHLYFTNRNIAGEAPAALLNWYYMVAGQQDVVRVSNGKETRDIPYAQFLKETLAGAAKPLQDQSGTSKKAKLESPERTKPDEKGKAAQSDPVSGEWMCDSNSVDGTAKTFFLFHGRQFAYSIGNTLRMVSLSYKASGERASGTFEERTFKGKTTQESFPYELTFRSSTPDRLVFDMKVKSSKAELLSSNECVPLVDQPGPKSKPSQASSSQASGGGDKVAAYANNLASELERSSHPTCQMLANSIRSFGNSGQPDYVRIRQVDNLFNKAPSICVR